MRRLLIILGFLLRLALPAPSAVNLPQKPQENPPLIHLRVGSFDPVKIVFPSSLIPSSPFAIVQFIGPVQEAWKESVTRLGGRFYDYLPDYAFVIKIAPEKRVTLLQLPWVRAVIDYRPEFKVDPSLSRLTGDIRALVSLFPGESPSLLFREAQERGLNPQVLSPELVMVKGTVDRIAPLARIPEVRWIERAPRPRLFNDRSRAILRVDNVARDFGLYGNGQIVAITDTGLDTGNPKTLSPDFQGRVVLGMGRNEDNDWADRVGHGTHITGIIASSGLLSGSDPEQKKYRRSFAGVAPEAKLVIQEIEVNLLENRAVDFDAQTDLTPFFESAYNAGARLHNNSWGDDDVDLGVYSLHSEQADRFVWTHPDYLITFAAGNDGKDGLSQKEFLEKIGIDPTKPLDLDKLIELIYGGVDGEGTSIFDVIEEAQRLAKGKIELGSLRSPGTAKNVITVGATEGNRPPGQGWGQSAEIPWLALGYFGEPIASDPVSDNPNGMAAFSGRGPTQDGRIKPDLVAPGTNIISNRSSLSTDLIYWGPFDARGNYAFAGGTSQSTAFVTGSATLVREWLQRYKNIPEPSAALIKGLLINTAVDLSPGQYGLENMEVPPRPNPVEGWGRVDVEAVIRPVAPRIMDFKEVRPGLTTGATASWQYSVTSSSEPLRITLVWTDPPGSPSSAKALVNDLDLTVISPSGKTYLGNGQPDRLNNVEGVDVLQPEVGSWRVNVRGVNVPQGPQPFVLVVSGAVKPEEIRILMGDLDGNGKVNLGDAVLALRIALGVLTPTPDQVKLADVAPKPGGDGKITIGDVVRILRRSMGLEPDPWP